MDTTNKTIDALDNIRRLIAELDNGYVDFMDVLIRLRSAVNDAASDKVISEQMYYDFNSVFEDHIRGLGLDTDELANIANKWIYYVDDADRQMSESVDFNFGLFDSDMHKNDSKDVLHQIMQALDRYVAAYSETNGALNAVDEFCEIGKIIKDAVGQDKLTNKTADALMEPLKQMKDNMFNPNIQNDAYDEFKRIIDEGLSREDEKSPQEQSQEQQNGETILSSVGNVLGRAVDAAVNGIKTAKTVINERDKAQQASGANPEQELVKKQENKDVAQKPEDLMRREDTVQNKKNNDGAKDQTQEQALAELTKLVNRYEQIYQEKGSVLDDDVLGVWQELTEGINKVVNNKLISDEFGNQLIDAHEFLRRNGLNSEKQLKGIDKFKQILDAQSQEKHSGDEKSKLQETPRRPDLEKSQRAEDVTQKPADLMQREDNTHGRVNADERKQEDYESLINGLEDVLAHHKDRDPDSFRRMMFAIKDLAQQGLLPEEMKQEYMDVFNRVKEFSSQPSSHEHGATQLSRRIIDHLDILEAKQQQEQKKPENKDVSQKPEDVMRRDDKARDEFFARMAKNYKGAEQKNNNNERQQRAEDVAQKPADLMQREEENRRKQENFKQGNAQVQKMDDMRDEQRKTLNQQALAAYRRKILEGRGTPNV